MLLDIGKFHADPHWGNLLIDDDTGTLTVIDFGLCCDIPPQDRENILIAMKNLLVGDYDSLVNSDAKRLGFLDPDFDTAPLVPLLTKVLTASLLGSNQTNRHKSLRAISTELNDIFFTLDFTVPPFFALLTRGLVLLEGIAVNFDEEFNLFAAAFPYVKSKFRDLLR